VSSVVIAASNLMPALRERLAGEGDLQTFADSEPIQALQAILDQRPDLIVIERLFAATPRGAALINRIKTDPGLGACEIRVMSHTGDYVRQVTRPTSGPASGATVPVDIHAPGGSGTQAASAASVATADGVRPLDWHGTRRAQRYKVKPGVEIQLDGSAVSVVDVSVVGAQVVSPTILRPNQKVRVTIPHEDTQVRCRGTIAWAKFELPKPTSPPVYRAGVEFLDADAGALDDFATRHRS
jgi:CheY-like chemotaxis protein